MNEESPRQKYIDKLQNDLLQASLSKRFIESEEGKYVINYITGVVSTLTNQLINSRKTHEEYIEIRAKIDVLRRLKQVLEAQSSETVLNKLQTDLELAQTGE